MFFSRKDKAIDAHKNWCSNHWDVKNTNRIIIDYDSREFFRQLVNELKESLNQNYILFNTRAIDPIEHNLEKSYPELNVNAYVVAVFGGSNSANSVGSRIKNYWLSENNSVDKLDFYAELPSGVKVIVEPGDDDGNGVAIVYYPDFHNVISKALDIVTKKMNREIQYY